MAGGPRPGPGRAVLSVVVRDAGDPVGLARCLGALAEGVAEEIVADAAVIAAGEAAAAVADAAGAALVDPGESWLATMRRALEAAPRGGAVLAVDARYAPLPGWAAAGPVIAAVAAAGPRRLESAGRVRVFAFEAGGGSALADAGRRLARRLGGGGPHRRLARLPGFIAARADLRRVLAEGAAPAPPLRLERLGGVPLHPLA